MRTRHVSGVSWYNVHFIFKSGIEGRLDVMPNCGCRLESYDFFGADYRILVNATEDMFGSVELWEGGVVTEKNKIPWEPKFISNGSYAETVEFLSALQEDRDPKPTPKDVLQSVDICSRIQEEYAR